MNGARTARRRIAGSADHSLNPPRRKVTAASAPHADRQARPRARRRRHGRGRRRRHAEVKRRTTTTRGARNRAAASGGGGRRTAARQRQPHGGRGPTTTTLGRLAVASGGADYRGRAPTRRPAATPARGRARGGGRPVAAIALAALNGRPSRGSVLAASWRSRATRSRASEKVL